jgi:hypothetical protein
MYMGEKAWFLRYQFQAVTIQYYAEGAVGCPTRVKE